MTRGTTIALLSLAGWTLAAPSPAGAQWASLGLSGHAVRRLCEQSGVLYACTNDGLYRLALGGPDTLWSPVGFGGEKVLDLVAIDSQTLLAAKSLTVATDDTVSLFRSIDAAASWQPFQNGFGSGGSREARRLLAPANAPGTVFAANNRIEKSTDGGLSWRVVGQSWVLNALEASPSNPGRFWAGGENAFFSPIVHESDDAGETWSWITLAADGDNAVDAIAPHPFDPDIVYLGMEGRVMMSDDGGATWKTLTTPTPSNYTFGLAVPAALPLRIYASGASIFDDPRGVVLHRSWDGGQSWEALCYPRASGTGVMHVLLREAETEETAYLATANGVLRFTQPTVDVPHRPGAAGIALRCAPNPFSRATTIEFTLPEGGSVSLRVLDPAGRDVAILLDAVLGAGVHHARLDGAGLRSGIYFCRLQAGDQVRSFKLLRLR